MKRLRTKILSLLLIVSLFGATSSSVSAAEGNAIYTGQEIYVASIENNSAVKAGKSNTLRNSKKGNDTVKNWNLLQNNVNPDYFLTEYHSEISARYKVTFKGKNYKAIVDSAKRQATGCRSDYEKIKKLCRYLAGSIYYDYPYYYGITRKIDWYPYDVWKSKRTICEGYSALYWTMADALGIPCMIIQGDNHSYNAAYDRESGRWIFLDVTWCSGNMVTDDGEFEEGDFNDKYFDMSLDFLLSIPNHQIQYVRGVLTISASNVTVAAGKKVTVTAPKKTSLTVKSNNTKVATANYNKGNGKITISGKQKGTATIAIKYGSLTKTVSVNVEATTTNLKLSKSNVTLSKVGKAATVKINASPKKSITGETPTVTCNNNKVVSVKYISKGNKIKIKALKKGKAKITVVVGKLKKIIKVTVK